MNCANHMDVAATAFCRNCGRPLCQACQRPVAGTILCDEHAPASSAWSAAPPPPGAAPYTAQNSPGAPPYSGSAAPVPGSPYARGSGVSPGLAFVLGCIPGVGAIYNGQYAKGLIHALIFGLILSIESSGAAPGMEPLMGIMAGIWFFYMAFEAYHTALKRQRGEKVDEFSSIFPLQRQPGRSFPVGPVVMIALGVVFLLNTLEIVRMSDVLRYWPVFLIVMGGYMLYTRVTESTPEEAPPVHAVPEAGHERQL